MQMWVFRTGGSTSSTTLAAPSKNPERCLGSIGRSHTDLEKKTSTAARFIKTGGTFSLLSFVGSPICPSLLPFDPYSHHDGTKSSGSSMTPECSVWLFFLSLVSLLWPWDLQSYTEEGEKHIPLPEKPVLMSYAVALALKGSGTFRCPWKLLILLPTWLVSKASQTALKTDANLIKR